MATKPHSTAPCDIPQTGKYTRYNRETMDHDAFYDGQYLGSRETEPQARTLCDEHVYDLISDGMMYTATQLDGGASDEEIAADYAVEDIAADMAEYAEETRLHCLDLDPFNTLIMDRADDLNLYLDGTGLFVVEEQPGQMYTFTRTQTAAIYVFFQGSNVRKRMTAVLRATLIEHGHGELVKRASVLLDTTPAPTIDRTSFHSRVGAAGGTLYAILTDMPCETGERALTLLTDLIELFSEDDLADLEPADIPGLAV
jgi:hypothetical protein